MSKFPDLWKYDGLWVMIYIHTLDWNLPMFWMRAAHGYFLPGQQFLQCRACIVAWSRQWWWRWRPSSLCLGDETPLCHWSGSYSTCKESGSNSRISSCSLHVIVLFVKHFGSTWLVDLTYLDKYHQNVEGCIEITTTLDSQDCFKTYHQHLCPPFHCVGGGAGRSIYSWSWWPMPVLWLADENAGSVSQPSDS